MQPSRNSPPRDAARPPGSLPIAPARRIERAGLAIVTLGLILPFLAKPFHLDDPVYLAVARQVLADPWKPYGFHFNWFGTSVPMWNVMLNPPGLGYLLAPLIRVLGEREVPLHLVFLAFPLLAAQSAYDIARRFTPNPFRAALLFAVAPMFAVSASTLMADVPALSFSLAALALLLTDIEGRRGAAVLSGIAASAAVLIKYNSIFVIPLLALAAILLGRRPLRHFPAVLLPILALVGWETINFRDIGGSHLLSAVAIVGHERRGMGEMILAAGSFLFLGMGSAPVLLTAALGRRDGRIALAVAIPIAIGLVARYGTSFGLSEAGPLALVVAMASAGGLAWVGLAILNGLSRSREALFLQAWLLGTLVQAVAFSYFVASRFLLPVLLPAILLPLRDHSPRATRLAIVISAALSLAVSSSDQDLARGYRDAAATLHARYGTLGPRLRFQGHWGFQYYLEREGHRPLDDRALVFTAEDVLATPRWALPIHYHFQTGPMGGGAVAEQEKPIDVVPRLPVTVMNRDTGAGFYCMDFGPLPFSWGARKIEHIDVIRFKGGGR